MTANQNVSTLLTMMYFQETPFYQETTRRYLASDVTEAKEFRDDCITNGIPKELMVYSNWRIDPDKVLGAGDQSLALGQATALYQARSGFDPRTQRMISRQFVSTLTGDPAKGMLYVPDAPYSATSGAIAAAQLFGGLMQGVEAPLVQGISQVEYIDTMLASMGLVIQQITNTDNVGTPAQIIGLNTVGQDIQKHLQIISADPAEKMNFKQFSDSLGTLDNLVKGFSARLADKQKASQTNLKEFLNISYTDLNPDTQQAVLQMLGLPPSQMPNTNPKLDAANQKLQLNAVKFQQSTKQKAISFQIDQIQKLTEHQSNLTQAEREHNQELIHAAAEKVMELYMASIQPASVPESSGSSE